MTSNEFTFRSKIWLWETDGPGSWHFMSLPKNLSKDIKQLFGESKRGFGSIRVEVTIGSTTWQTSIFPESKSGTYILPLKAQVRNLENLTVDQTKKVSLHIIV